MFSDIVKIAASGVMIVMIVVFLKGWKSDLAVPVTLAGCVLLLTLVISLISGLMGTLRELFGKTGLENGELESLMKIIGTAYIADFSAGVCRDAGETAVAGKIELAGRVCIVIIALPLAVALLATIQTAISG